MVPTIGTSGFFSFSAPFDKVLDTNQQLTVASIRDIQELAASEEDPLNNIYVKVGLTETDMANDIATRTPIITLRTDGGEYVYIPANKITSGVKLTGVKYVEKALIVNLGYLPVNESTALALQVIKDDIYNTIGMIPDIIETNTSSIVNVSDVKHTALTTTRNNKKTISKSYRTRYEELLVLYNNQKQLIANIESVYKVNGVGG